MAVVPHDARSRWEDDFVTGTHADNVAFLIPVVGVLAYCVAGGAVWMRWQRRTLRQRPPALHNDPEAYLSYLLPQLIAFELLAWFNAVVGCSLILFVIPNLLSLNGLYLILGFGIGIIGFAVLFVGLDVWLAARIRAIVPWPGW
jgi:hypothetical protein